MAKDVISRPTLETLSPSQSGRVGALKRWRGATNDDAEVEPERMRA